jgi:hypothetical protein
MRSRFCFGFILTALLIGSILDSPAASAQSFSFAPGGFNGTNVCAKSGSPAQGCQVLTNGIPNLPQIVNGGILRLNGSSQNQHGSAWFGIQQPLSTGFTTAFQFQISKSCATCSFPGDGLALVIQNDPAGTGAIGYTGNGHNISYGNEDISTGHGPNAAILNSLAVELDTFQNSEYGDPDGNHIAVQSCGPNNPSTLTPNSADHNYVCPDGNPAKLALQSLPSGLSLSDGKIHTITVNYLPPANCTASCNNLSVYFDSTLILQATVDIAKQLNLTGGSSAYIGFTSATGAFVENSDIISWSFSQWPLAPITINQPVQTTITNFNYTSNLSAVTDYSQSGLPASVFNGLFMQGTVQTITDQQFTDLVANTPFQGSTCQHQDTGNGSFACVTTTDLCTSQLSSIPAGANCLGTDNTPLINVSNTYDLDPTQKSQLIAPGYIMGKDNALGCGAAADNSCKGLVSVFTSINGDALTTGGHTKNFNSVLIPILGSVQPSTSVTTTPPLNSGWTNGNVSVNFNSIDSAPPNNTNPPATVPTVTSINYAATGSNLPSPASGTLTGASGSVNIPVTTEGTTTITYSATDNAGIIETVVTSSGNSVSSASPTFTIKVDLTAPTVICTPPAVTWQAADVVVPCTASDNANGSGLVGPSSFAVQTNVPAGTETPSVTIPAVTVNDVAGNTSAPQPAQGTFGPFEVDKKAPVIAGPTISPASPVFGQTVTANYECTDGGSGVVSCGPNGSSPIATTGDTGVLTSPADGTIGTHTFNVNARDQVGNASAASSVTYTIAQAVPTITWANPAAITYGTALSPTQLNATANVAGTFAYNPPAGTVLTAGMQPLSVTFTPTDTADYAHASAAVSLVVNKATPTITWPTPAPISQGTPLSATQLNATASVPGTFMFTPAAGTVLPAGTRTLSAVFTPTDAVDYTSAIAQVSILVGQPRIGLSPIILDFGTVALGKTLTKTETLSNTGQVTLNLNSISIFNGITSDKDDFTFTKTCGATLAPGASCSISITFNADDAGARAAVLVLTDNAPGGIQLVPLVGLAKKGK